MSDNGDGELRKKCPFLNEWCIGDSCALFTQVVQTKIVLGVTQQAVGGMCGLGALPMIMSRPIAPPQHINLPRLKG